MSNLPNISNSFSFLFLFVFVIRSAEKINELNILLDKANKICKDRGEQVAILKEEIKGGNEHKKIANAKNELNVNLENELLRVRNELIKSRKETSIMEEKMEKKLKSMQKKNGSLLN